jgi:uncharacterized protein YoaH (UPF0181 family)
MPDEINNGAPAAGQAPAGQGSGADEGSGQQGQAPAANAAQGQGDAPRSWKYGDTEVDGEVVDTGLWVLQISSAAKQGDPNAIAQLRQMFPYLSAEQKQEAKQTIQQGQANGQSSGGDAELRKKIDEMERREKQREYSGRLQSKFENLRSKHKPETYHKDTQLVAEAIADAVEQRGGNGDAAYQRVINMMAEYKKSIIADAMKQYQKKSFNAEGPGGAAALPKPSEKPMTPDERKRRIKEKIETGAYEQ